MNIPAILFWIGCALILFYELYAFHEHQGKTISEITWRISLTHPLIPLLFGILMGHFFWQSTSVYLNLAK